LHVLELNDPDIMLDVTSDPWLLSHRNATIVKGRDVVRPGSLSPEKPRRPILTSIPAADRPLTRVLGSGWFGRTSTRFSDTLRDANVATVTNTDWNNSNFNLGHGGGNFFASYTFHEGDWFVCTQPAGNVFAAQVQSRLDADKIKLFSTIGPTVGGNTIDGYVVRGRGYIVDETALIMSREEWVATGGWDTAIANGVTTENEDERKAAIDVDPTGAVSTTWWANDSLTTGAGQAAEHKMHILYSETFDKRGIWVTNGRKFWLLQAGTFTQYLDLGSDTYIGAQWRMTQIAEQLALLVSPGYPPLILHLNRDATTGAFTNADYAGMPPPYREYYFTVGKDFGGQIPAQTFGLYMDAIGSGGSMNVGDVKVKVRAVNDDNSLESELAHVYDTAGTEALTVVANDQVTVYCPEDADAIRPVLSPRCTHLEIWRTTAGTDNYFLEDRIEIAQQGLYGNENPDRDAAAGDDPEHGLVRKTPDNGTYPCTLSDDTLGGKTALTAADEAAGGLPPICQDAITLQSVTLCFGKANSDATTTGTFYSYVLNSLVLDWTASIKRLGQANANNPGGGGARNLFADYSVNDADDFVITHGGTTGMPLGAYDIASKASTQYLTMTDEIHPSDSDGVHGYIRRSAAVTYPVIESDEDVWYSRTDKFAPESFPTRTLRLSDTGDTFRKAVVVNRYAAVVMNSGVHLLYLSGTSLAHDVISDYGEGTPWADSVVVVGDSVIWAHPDGPRVMQVSPEANEEGRRAHVQRLEPEGRLRNWFRAAADNGERVDTIYDEYNTCLRFRRTMDSNTYQSLQYSLLTKQWTLLDDDNGIGFISTPYAESTLKNNSAAYSVDQSGAVFELNTTGTDPLAALTVQATTDKTYTVTETSISKTDGFSDKFVGIPVRFRSTTNSTANEAVRIIRTATAHKITFDTLSGLSSGDEYIIGATRFEIKWANLVGAANSVKTLQGMTVKALPGTDNDSSVRLSARAYREFDTTPVDSQARTIEVRDWDAEGKAEVDRAVDVSANGTALEVGIECSDARADFRVRSVDVRILEEADMTADGTAEQETAPPWASTAPTGDSFTGN
jgi:hypothetical protein